MAKKSELVAAVAAEQKAVAVVEEENNFIIGDMPDYLKGNESTGIEALQSQDDFKMPRIKLLQTNSPEITTHQGIAIPGEYWHTVANVSLGSSFVFVPCIVSKRVILWRPQEDNGGGILAFSKDGIKWDNGANQKFTVKIKGRKEPMIWDTKENVAHSGLTNFGTKNPDEGEKSAPAATVCYEYLAYLPKFPFLSPSVLGVYKTGVPNAKQLNTNILMRKRPSATMAIKCATDIETGNGNSWFIPLFDMLGFVNKELFKVTGDIADKYKDFETELPTDGDAASQPAATTVDTDKVEY